MVKSTKRDSSHLELPTVAEKKTANTSRFQAPLQKPILYAQSETGQCTAKRTVVL